MKKFKMITDIPKSQIVNSPLNNECTHFESNKFVYNYLCSDFIMDGKLFLPISNKSMATSTDVMGVFAKSKYLKYFSKDFTSFFKSNIDKFQIRTNCYVVGSSDNYYHCLLDFFPKLFGINDHNLNKFDNIVLGKNYLKKSMMLETLLNKIKIKKKIIFLDEKTYFFNNSIMPFKSGLIQTINSYKKIFSNELSNSPFRNIYISRLDSNNRVITNEKDLINYLEKYNFEIYTLSNLNFLDQIKLFNESKTIISMHGAALSNLIFANKRTKVIEIAPNFNLNKQDDWFDNTKNIIGTNQGLVRNHFRLLSLKNDLNHYFYFSSMLDDETLKKYKSISKFDQIKKVTNGDLTLNIDLFSKFIELQNLI